LSPRTLSLWSSGFDRTTFSQVPDRCQTLNGSGPR
jgi:hypothetical protein